MTVDEILTRIHTLLEKDTDYPESGDEDYTVRLDLVKDAVGVWEKDDDNGTKWKELFTTLADAADGDKVTVADEDTYDCPSDFAFPVGYLRLGSGDTAVYYQRIEPYQAQEYDQANIDAFYVTGNKSDGFKIHLVNSTPNEDDLAINYDYYKTATVPTTGSDVLEMDDYQFAVYWALAELVKDEDPGLSSQYASIATQKLDAMRLRNMTPDYYQDNTISDSFVGFGR